MDTPITPDTPENAPEYSIVEVLTMVIANNMVNPSTTPGSRDELATLELFLTSLNDADLENPLSDEMKLQALINFSNERAREKAHIVAEYIDAGDGIPEEKEAYYKAAVEALSAGFVIAHLAEELIAKKSGGENPYPFPVKAEEGR